MEKVAKPLKMTFIYTVAYAAILVVILSALTVFLCIRLQKLILPNSNEAILSITAVNQSGIEEKQQHRFQFGKEMSIPMFIGISYDGEPAPEVVEENQKVMSTTITIDKIDNSFSMLSSKKKAAYIGLGITQIILPLLYSVTGILLSASWFYKKKLSEPIRILSGAAQDISNQNLDFEISYTSTDEMGLLCESFEKMRRTLYDNHRELWGMAEKRRMLMASVAHDLRNPISIMEGYLEYLQKHIADHTISNEDILNMVGQIASAAVRMERYTDSLRNIHHLEEQELHISECRLPELLNEMADIFLLLGRKKQINIEIVNLIPACKVLLDSEIMYRILENLFSNALRFAKSRIQISFEIQNHFLISRITDDGIGFPEKLLQTNKRLFFTTDTSGEHMGMGLAVCEILSRKHGGNLVLSNLPDGGASVETQMEVDKISET